MKKKSLLLILLMVLFVPWAAKGQTLTVCDGTATNAYIPVYGWYADTDGLTSEFIIPGTQLTTMNGKAITALKFYLSTPAESAWTATFKVYMKETIETTLTGITGPESCTVVYTGTLDGSGDEMDISFDNSYIYNGGNLLIGTYVVSGGNYEAASFSGIESTGSAYYEYESSWYGPTGGVQNFLPKTTFTYEAPSSCYKPQNLQATLTPGNGTIATLTWERNAYGTEDAWVLEYGTKSDFTNATSVNVTGGTPSKNLTGLTPEATYYAHVKPDCDNDGTKWSNICTFTPTNDYIITVNDGSGTNDYIPIYGFYVDQSIVSQFIIPSTVLTAIQWGTINKLTFYASTSSTTWTGAEFEVYMTEVDYTTFTSTTLVDWTTMEKVMNASSLGISDNIMEITLNAPYQYLGSNLLIGIKQTKSGSWETSTWKGVAATGASLGGNGTGSQQNFLPKTTFAYTPGSAPSCYNPKSFTVGEVTNHTAALSWTKGSDSQTAWHVYYSKSDLAPADDISLTQVIDVTTTPEKTLTGLDAETTYYAWVRGNCGTDDYSSWVGPRNFTTDIACAAPTAITITDIGSQIATINVTGGASTYNIRYKAVDASSKATVTLTAGDVWGDESGYQMLLDNTHTLYGTTIPTTGALSSNCTGNDAIYAKFSDKIPTNADGECTTANIVIDNSLSIEVSSGIYDWCITNPSPGDRIWIAAANGNVGGRQNDYVFLTGLNYEFTVTLDGENDRVDVTTTEGSAGTGWTTLSGVTSPREITGLTPETLYEVQVQSVCGGIDGESQWVGTFFSTLSNCPTPTGLAASNLTQNTAHITWTGSPEVDDYTVQYRTSAFIDGISEGFDNSSIPEGWSAYSGLFNEAAGTATLTDSPYAWSFGSSNGVFDSHARVNIYSNYQKWLVTPKFTVITNTLTFDMALTAFTGTSVPAPQLTGTDDKFMVMVSTDNMSTWTVLRKWDNAGSTYVYNEIANTAEGEQVSIDMTSYNGQNVYIAFYGESTESNADNNLHIDNVNIGEAVPAGSWTDASTNVTNQYYDLTGLTAGKKYDVKVKSNCTSGVYCEPITLKTLAEGNKVFTTAGDWNTAANWIPSGVPTSSDNAIIRANVTIPNGIKAVANKLTIDGSEVTITIANGGRLEHMNSSSVPVIIEKTITGYGDGDYPWHLISTSFASTIYNSSFATNAINLISATADNYDLYWFDGTQLEKQWRNYKPATSFDLTSGKGYLYANKNTVTLRFKGNSVKYDSYQTVNGYSYLTYNIERPFGTLNLIGNTYTSDAYVYLYKSSTYTKVSDLYKMNEEGNEIELSDDATIAPNEGVFIASTASSQYARLSPDGDLATTKDRNNGMLNITVNKGRKKVDVARIRFGEGDALSKYQLNTKHSKLYIPQSDKDYAVVFKDEAKSEMPLNFMAETTGTYTLNIKVYDIELDYLRLIDNFTGEVTDLLIESEYTFIGSPRDDENRFRIMFSANGIDNETNDIFVYQNDDELIVNGNGELQVYDVMGRHVASYEINGSERLSASQFSNAVYIFRLVGNDIKTQKIVVR